MKVLVASAEPALRGIAGFGLERLGHTVETAVDGADVLLRWLDDPADLALLDGDLPVLSGFNVCRILRRGSSVPILLFVRPLDEQELIRGYEYGADDCIIKPFGMRQLQLRIEAVLRRHRQPEHAMSAIHAGKLEFLDLALNRTQVSIKKHGQPLTLTRTEYRLLELLIDQAEHFVAASELIRYATGHQVDRDRGNLKVHMSRLRHKLAKAGGIPLEIRAYPRFGYMLTNGSVGMAGVPNGVETAVSLNQPEMKLSGLEDLAVVGLQFMGSGQQ